MAGTSGISPGELFSIRAALDQFNLAFARGSPHDVTAVWPEAWPKGVSHNKERYSPITSTLCVP